MRDKSYRIAQHKSLLNSNYFKCKCIKLSNQKNRLAEWIKTCDPTRCYLQETHSRFKDTKRLKMKGQKKILHANSNEKRTSVAILISDKKILNQKIL